MPFKQHQQVSHQSTSEQPYHPAPSEGTPPQSPFHTLPPGWTTATDPSDGRLFYLEISTGRTSWAHPHAALTSSNDQTARQPPIVQASPDYYSTYNPDNKTTTMMDTPFNATRRPDTNQCYSLVSCILFPPLGIIALIHSYLTDRAWKQGRYSDAIGHAREAPKYAGFAVCVGIAFWIWWLFLREEAELDWFQDWDFNFGD